VPTANDVRKLFALLAFVGFLTGAGFSLRVLADCDPLTESWREDELDRELQRHPWIAAHRP
jgi:hypothetical protein